MSNKAALPREIMTASNPSAVRLLLVEDDLVLQKITLRLLKRLGHDADLANDGAEAVQMASSKCYDIIFMDVNLPILDGVKAAEQISRRKSAEEGLDRPPFIIALTAGEIGQELGRYRAAGIVDWIAKPVQLDALRLTIEKWTA